MGDKRKRKRLIIDGIGQDPTRLRVKEVSERENKINIEATVSGLRLRYATTFPQNLGCCAKCKEKQNEIIWKSYKNTTYHFFLLC